ncbi:MAG: hypothetical protein ACQEXJ_00425 [Myxococcota bacterium]
MKRGLAWLVVAVAAVALGVPAAWAQEGEGGGGSETPAEALEKAKQREAAERAPGLGGFAGGVYRVSAPEDDLVEPVPVGTEEEFEDSGYEVRREGEIKIIVDEAGQIYVDRTYHGVIPGIRNSLWDLDRLANQDLVLWTGFQPMAAVSRVYWLLSDPAPRFEVTRLGDKRLEVFFPGARVLARNTVRAMITEHFATPIRSIEGKRLRRGVRYIIKLKHPTNYLYRFEAPFLYLDFETNFTAATGAEEAE